MPNELIIESSSSSETSSNTTSETSDANTTSDDYDTSGAESSETANSESSNTSTENAGSTNEQENEVVIVSIPDPPTESEYSEDNNPLLAHIPVASSSSSLPIKRIILEGGGVKGVAFVGGLRVLYDENMLGSVKQVAGSSAGGIVAALFAVGYTVSELEDIFKEIDFEKLKDDKFGIFRDMARLFKRFGIYRGEYLKKLMRAYIAKKMGTGHCTFKYLYDEAGMELLLTGTNINYRRTDYFHHSTTPDMEIADAVRITMSIPYFFKAVEYNGCIYADGGVACNYPFKSFWEIENKDSKMDLEYLQTTIGMKVENSNEMLEHDGVPVKYPVGNIIEYSEGLIDTMRTIIERHNTKSDALSRTVLIPTKISATKFDLTNEEKKELYNVGYDTMFNFIRE